MPAEVTCWPADTAQGGGALRQCTAALIDGPNLPVAWAGRGRGAPSWKCRHLVPPLLCQLQVNLPCHLADVHAGRRPSMLPISSSYGTCFARCDANLNALHPPAACSPPEPAAAQGTMPSPPPPLLAAAAAGVAATFGCSCCSGAARRQGGKPGTATSACCSWAGIPAMMPPAAAGGGSPSSTAASPPAGACLGGRRSSSSSTPACPASCSAGVVRCERSSAAGGAAAAAPPCCSLALRACRWGTAAVWEAPAAWQRRQARVTLSTSSAGRGPQPPSSPCCESACQTSWQLLAQPQGGAHWPQPLPAALGSHGSPCWHQPCLADRVERGLRA